MLYQNSIDLMYLCGCALRQEAPDEKLCARMDLPAVFAQSERQSLSALSYEAISLWGGFTSLPEKLRKQWKFCRMNSTRKSILMRAEREKICTWFEENNIWYMPLKGSILEAYYPDFGLREMSDNDILINPKARQKVRDYMVKECGYEISEYSPIESYDDVYKKQPIYIFEMHKRLFEEDTPIHEAYYSNVADRLLPVVGKRFEKQFSNEDFYLYVLSHAHRHFEASGAGLRLLVDCYVWAHAKKMDREYLNAELKKLDMVEFEKTCYALSEKLLSTGSFELTQHEERMLKYLEQCGTFGNEEIREENRVMKQMKSANMDERTAKQQLFIRRLFPDLHYYELRAPFVFRHKMLIPFYWVWRLIRKLSAGGIMKEIHGLIKTSVQEDLRP